MAVMHKTVDTEFQNETDYTAKDDSALELELRILGALRQIIQGVDVHSRKLSGQVHVTAPQLVTLLYVVRNGPITPSDLARSVHLSNSTIVGILDRLESKGLLYRERGTRDRRQVFVTATPEGQALAESAPSPLHDDFAASLNKLPEDEGNTIAESLERIVDMMKL